MRERGGNMIAYVVKDTTASTLLPLIKENVMPDTHIMTDEWGAYNSLHKDYKHSRIKHKSGQYVDGVVHTNSIEGCWALLRRGFIGTYHQMSRKHLQSYVDEFVFRNDTRSYTEQERFDFFFSNMENRLRYKVLVQQ
jgi:transposase-like protein